MATTIPPDPFKILGVGRDADAAIIKKAYRKLVLSCHPDKVTDESLKAQKQEEFHQIQQAYETIGDPEKRIRYELEQKAKKLREERDREFASSKSTPTKSSPAQARHVNVNIYTAHPPPEFRSSSSKHTPSKPTTSHKPYSAEFAKSWESNIPTRSRDYYDDVKRTRRAASDEKLKRDRDDSRERKRDEIDRERRRLQREREQQRDREDEERRRRRRIEKEEKERAEKQQARLRREQEERERERSKAKRAERERERDLRRRQEAEDKLRSRTKAFVESYSEEEEDIRRSRAKKSTKKDGQTRDKSASKGRERLNPSVEDIADMPPVPVTTEAKITSNMAFAAHYIMGKGTSKKHTTEPKFSPEFPNPADHVFQRRASAEGKHAKAEAVHTMEGGSPTRDRAETTSVPPPQQQAPPRLQKSYTMPHVPTNESAPQPPPRIPLGRSHTMEPGFFSRMASADKHSSSRPSRGRTSLDDDDYYFARPRVQKYKVGNDGGKPRVYETAQYKDPYAQAPGAPFGKVKTSQPYGTEHLSTSRRYGEEQPLTADYGSPSYSDYRSPYVTARS